MQITSEYIQHDKIRNVLYLASEFFGGTLPKEVEILSRNTGRVVKYIQDTELAIQNEFWDGEFMEYYAPNDPDVPRLNVAHEW
jgi:hypothetical protein